MLNLIMTGTINPEKFNNTGVVLTSVSTRLSQYKKAIEFYIKDSPFENIIFVENSQYPFNEKEYRILASKYNKRFEFIPIQTNLNETIRKGKSYGEADCIEKAITNSKSLSKEKSFYKITGRIILKNSTSMIRKDDNTSFLFRHDLKKCYTFFFKANIEQYLSVFKDCKDLCDEKKGFDIETVYYKIIREQQLTIKSFNTYPLIIGTIGTTGDTYNDNKFIYTIKNVLTKLGLYSQKGIYLSNIINILAQFRLLVFAKHKSLLL